jgi:hypothetical protein
MQLPSSAAPDDILDTLEPAALPVHDFPWVPVLIVASVAVLIALAVYIWRRRHRPVVVESLEQAARRRLKQLDTTDPRALHTELAAILTQYAERRLGLRGTRLTSAEILRAFRDNGVMSAAWQDSLADFLRACDQAKFAPVVDPSDLPARVAQCRTLLEDLSAAFASSPKLSDPWRFRNAGLRACESNGADQ